MNAQKTEGDIYTNSGYGRGIPSRPSIAQSDKLFWSTRAAKTKRRLSAANDLVLIERLKAGEQQALEILFDRYSPKLYNLAHRILRNVPDTEEVIQDVFWTAYRKAESFRGQSEFSTWLYRLTVNGALGRIRERKKDKTVDYKELCPSFEKAAITSYVR